MARRVASQKGAKKRADVLFSKLVRARGRCEKCGESRYDLLQTAHIASRRFSATRCDPQNALCLCAGCHHYFTDHPVEFGRWVIAYLGEDRYEAVLRKAMQTTPRMDWNAEVERLKALVPVVP